MLLTKKKALAKVQEQREKHRASNDGIKIYNTARATRCNPFAGDTTVLDWTVDNRTDSIIMTEQELIDSVIFSGKRYHVRKSDVQLSPDMVSEEIKDYYRQKISGSALRSARNYRDKVIG